MNRIDNLTSQVVIELLRLGPTAADSRMEETSKEPPTSKPLLETQPASTVTAAGVKVCIT